MEQYEHQTGKQAIWNGKITKGFLKWKAGEKDYYANQKRISVYISSETEKKWQEFIKSHTVTSYSKLIREGVNYYINEKSKFGGKIISELEDDKTSDMVHVLKEKLTTIKGFSQLALDKYNHILNDDLKSIINNILNDIKELENNFIMKLEEKKSKPSKYDVLFIEDDESTILLLKNYFENNGYSFKGVLTGVKGIEELSREIPKLILIDIILPDVSGYKLCKDIKSHDSFKNVPVFYVTAVPESKVESKIQETMADGYILKPFNLLDLKFLFEYLQS
jgi:CheY-like chemotaxis protein